MTSSQIQNSALLSPDEWLQVLDEEYLEEYVPSGYSCVKFVSGTPPTLEFVMKRLEEVALRREFHYSFLDPGRRIDTETAPKLHSIDQLYFALTRDIDWKACAADQARLMLNDTGIRVTPEQRALNLHEIAAENDLDIQSIYHEFRRRLTAQHIRDRGMGAEFRNGMAALVYAQLEPSTMPSSTEDVLLGWFRGVALKGGAKSLKTVQIFERINPANAWTMLKSFTHWLPTSGRHGLMAVLDFRPYESVRVPQSRLDRQVRDYLEEIRGDPDAAAKMDAFSAELQQPDILYSPKAYRSMLGLLRAFIDATGEIERTALIVLTSPEYHSDAHYSDRSRRVTDYDALQTRIGQEVHDTRYTNPCAALVHLGATP